MGRTERSLLLLRRARLLAAALAVAACGCSSPEPVAPSHPDAAADTSSPFAPDACKPSIASGAMATAIIGQGQSLYEDVSDGAVLTWEKGPQGGHHIWVAVRQRDLRRFGTLIHITLEDVEDPANPKLINDSTVIYGFTPDEGGWCALFGLRMQLDNSATIVLSDLQNHHVRISVDLRDPDGAEAKAQKTVVVQGDPT